jgi:hypothetical protein
VGKVKLELTYNPDTSMVGVRLHEHTLSEKNTGDDHTISLQHGGITFSRGALLLYIHTLYVYIIMLSM